MQNWFDTAPDHRKNGSYRWEQPAGRKDVIGMGTADLDYCCPECIKKACLAVAQENVYNCRKLPDTYFQAVTGWYQRKYSLNLEPDWLSNIPSSIGAIRIALSALTCPGDTVIMQSPFFGPLAQAVLEKLVALCEKYNVKIISDEVHGLIIYPGKKHIPILCVSAAARARSVQVTSMSKGFNLMALPHAIIAIADPSLREAWHKTSDPFDFYYASNPFSVAAVTKVMDGSADQWLAGVTDYLQKNRDMAVSFLQREVPGMTVTVPEGSFLLWIDCSGLNLAHPAEFLLEKARVSVNDGAAFGNAYGQFIRVNFALTRQKLQEALERIRQALDEKA